jgi:chromatin segregation and condensation protein Rec8/ScpA/Scc1 (kleisin family)
LVRDYLAFFDHVVGTDVELASEALPKVAQVIDLRVRFLLPRFEEESQDDDEFTDEVVQTVFLLEELEEAIGFLRERREKRRLILPTRVRRPDYARPQRPVGIGIGKLMELAGRYVQRGYFEVAIERFTVAAAMKRLMATLRRFRRGSFRELTDSSNWVTRALFFAAMLELLKQGKVRARQEEQYGDIELELGIETVREVA